MKETGLTGKRRSTTIAATPDDGNSHRKRRRRRACTDQIATLRIIVEQSIEWNLSIYVNFVDYEKAFDSLDRETLWKI